MKHVLFVCTHNAGRSQMAQAFFEQLGPDDVRASSAGTEPAREVWPAVIEAMGEVGIDLTGRRPRKLTLEMQLQADWAVLMGCGDACPFVPTRVDDWDLPDPAGQGIDQVRAIRDEVRRRVKALIDDDLEAIRTDPTAHQMRLVRLLPALHKELSGERTPEEIRFCADRVLGKYAEAPVRSFVFVLAHRETRECLRSGGCDVDVSSAPARGAA